LKGSYFYYYLGVNALIDSDDEDFGPTKKRPRKVISDDESEDDNKSEGSDPEDEEEEEEGDGIESIQEEDTEKPLKAKAMFDKRGRLRKEFLENEAELSGSEEEISEDEDERGLDRYRYHTLLTNISCSLTFTIIYTFLLVLLPVFFSQPNF
jgi:hypothetical protein